MGKEDGRGRSRRRRISRARKFLNHEGKKLCASALCVSMLFGSVMNTTIAASKETDDDGYEFELSRASLYQALQDAVLNGSTVDEELEFYGSAAEEYSELLAPGGSLYELKPELKDNDGSLKLRVFAKLDQEIELDSEYEAAGTEEIMFLLTNRSDEPQKAVICVDDKYTEEIEVAPGGAIAVPEDEAAQGPAGGGTAGGGASAGGGAAGGENAGAGETAGPADESGQAPDSGETPAQTQPEETTGAKEETDADTSEDVSAPTEETGNAGDSQAPADETEGVSDSGQTEESGAAGEENDSTAAEDGNAAGGENDSDQGNSPAGENGSGETGNTAGKEENGADGSGNAAGGDGNSGAAESGDQTDTGSGENTGSSTENGSSSAAGSENSSAGSGSASGNDSPAGNTGAESDGGNDSSDSVSEGEKTAAASISLHRASLVAAPAKEDPMATDSELPVATDSELATDSEMEKLIDGDLYEAVRLKEDGAVLFVTTLDDLGVMDGWGPIVFGQQFEQEIDGFRVRAIARKGVLPDGAEMSVMQLTPEEHPDQYNEAVNALAEAGTQYEGMAALDISFHDSEGTEIEPNGEVQVSIELKEGALPEDADPSTVVVQHLKETGDAIQVEKVADASNDTDGIVALADELTDPDEIEVSDEAQAVAAFRVESFSTFTITWQSSIGLSVDVKLHYVSQNGAELGKGVINTDDLDKTITTGERNFFSSYVGEPTDNSLEYLGAHYGAYNGTKVTAFEAFEEGKGLRKSYGIRFYGETNNEVDTVYITIGEWNPGVDIYLVFGPGEEVDPPVPSENMLTKSKTVTYNEGKGTYDLSLSVSGSKGSIENKAKVDVLFIVDTSSSMNENIQTGGSFWDPTYSSKLKVVTNAIDSLVDAIKENDGIDAQYSVVEFGSKSYLLNNANDGWNENVNVQKIELAENHWDGNEAYAGTNYEDAIYMGIEQLREGRIDAEKYVIFLSDGLPTFRNTSLGGSKYKRNGRTYNWYGTGQGDRYYPQEDRWQTEDDKNVLTCLKAAATEIKGMNCTGFYAVGVGENDDFEPVLQQLLDNVGAEKKLPPMTATNTNELEQAFDDIKSSIISFMCSNVTVTDPLSQYVKPVVSENGSVRLKITVDKGNGEQKEEYDSIILEPTEDNKNRATITAEYEDGKIILDFPDNYQLEEGWTYTVTMEIDATEQAYKEYRDSLESDPSQNPYPPYPHMGDKGTGTHEEESGFYSNAFEDGEEKATVTYTYNGENKTEEFAKPVVQIHPGKLVITKKIVGNLTKAELEKLKNTLKFNVMLKWPDDGTPNAQDITFEKQVGFNDPDFKFDETNQEYTYTIENLSPDTTYAVTEIGAELDGYQLTSSSENVNGVIEKGGSAEAEFTNTYEQNLSLTIQKKLDGDMAETDREFKFSITVNSKPYVSSDPSIIDGEFTLGDGQEIQFDGLKKGDQIEVNEIDGAGYTTSIEVTPGGTEDGSKPLLGNNDKTYSTGSDGLTATTIVTFTNRKDSSDIPPTGIFTDKLPYLLMSSVAILCTAGVLFNNSIKRRRENEE